MQTYGHYEFEELLKDADNQRCFDCNKSPAYWASVSNAVYLCIACSGVHRGYAVNVSFVRSVTLDSWNDNQISMMKNGGNRALKELLNVYGIDVLKVDKSVLYNSRLLDFYRRLLKSKVNNQPFDKAAPSKDEALKSLNVSTNNDNSKFISVTSKVSQEKIITSVSSSDNLEEDSGFIGALNGWMGKAMTSTKYIAEGGFEIGSKIINTGSVLTETSGSILDKGTEVAKSDKVQSFAKKANQTINSLINIMFGGTKEDKPKDKEIKSDSSSTEFAKIDSNNQVKFEKK